MPADNQQRRKKVKTWWWLGLLWTADLWLAVHENTTVKHECPVTETKVDVIINDHLRFKKRYLIGTSHLTLKGNCNCVSLRGMNLLDSAGMYHWKHRKDTTDYKLHCNNICGQPARKWLNYDRHVLRQWELTEKRAGLHNLPTYHLTQFVWNTSENRPQPERYI